MAEGVGFEDFLSRPQIVTQFNFRFTTECKLGLESAPEGYIEYGNANIEYEFRSD